MGSVRQRRIAVAIVLSTLGLTSLFLAQGSTSLLAGALLELDPSVVESAATAGGRPGLAGASRDRVDPTPILQRNIFDSETGDLTVVQVEETEEPDEPLEEIDPDAPPPRCDGPLRLVASLVNARLPEWSFASITTASGAALLYRAGMEVEGRTLLAIQPDKVYMRPSSGNVCHLAMFAPEEAGGPGSVSTRPRVRARVAGRDDEEMEEEDDSGAISSSDLDEGISRVSDTEYTVARSLVDSLLENQAELMRTARIIPHQENGRTVGVKMYGIRRNSLLGKLGLQNGDMLRTINGYDMTSPDSALEAYARLRNANNLTVSVVRRGQAQTLNYNIQ